MASLLTIFAAGSGICAPHTFLGLLPWYYYLDMRIDFTSGTCEVVNFTLLGSNSSLLLILLAIVDDLLRIAGLVAVGMIMYAGVKYITSQGSPDETARSLSTIINSLIGLAITLGAIGLVSYLGTHLGTGQGGLLTMSNGAKLDLNALPNPAGVGSGSFIQDFLRIVFAIIGATSVLFVVIGGFRYVVSTGDPRNVSQAKSTILYALIGLAVAIVAESIVSGALSKL